MNPRARSRKTSQEATRDDDAAGHFATDDFAPGDEVRVNGELVTNANKKPIYLSFHKPAGIECTTNLSIPDNIVDYINYPERVFPIGRLDKASEGLIFMTNHNRILYLPGAAALHREQVHESVRV